MHDERLREALEIVAEIRRHLARGAAPADLIARLEVTLRGAGGAADVAETHRLVADLLAQLDLAQRDGQAWLEQVLLPDLEVLSRRQEASAAYRRCASPG